MQVPYLCLCELLIMHACVELMQLVCWDQACMCGIDAGCVLWAVCSGMYVVGSLQVPCAAMGLLHTMEATLLERRVWSGALDMLPAPAFLSLMLLLVPLHPLLHAKVTSPRFLVLA